MKNNFYERNELIWGKEAQKILFKKHIAVFGLGGVGSYAAEAVARAGIGNITVIDFDQISESNVNRQLLALNSSVGKEKAALMQERIKDINPNINVTALNCFCTRELAEEILLNPVDYVIDAIDTVKAKIDLIEICTKKNIPVITSLGAGNRLDPEQLYTADISEINPRKCPFARNVVNKLKKLGINKGITVVVSKEKPVSLEKKINRISIKTETGDKIEFKKITPGSSPFVPPVAGYIMAGCVVRNLI